MGVLPTGSNPPAVGDVLGLAQTAKGLKGAKGAEGGGGSGAGPGPLAGAAAGIAGGFTSAGTSAMSDTKSNLETQAAAGANQQAGFAQQIASNADGKKEPAPTSNATATSGAIPGSTTQ